MMTKNQLRKALLRIPNVMQFCARYSIPRRTVMRLREADSESVPRSGTILLMEQALKQEGLVKSGDSQRKKPAPRRKPARVAGRDGA
jgi:hypothetical protein